MSDCVGLCELREFQLFYHKTNEEPLREEIATTGLGVQKCSSRCMQCGKRFAEE